MTVSPTARRRRRRGRRRGGGAAGGSGSRSVHGRASALVVPFSRPISRPFIVSGSFSQSSCLQCEPTAAVAILHRDCSCKQPVAGRSRWRGRGRATRRVTRQSSNPAGDRWLYSCNPYGESLLRDECRLQLQSLWRIATAAVGPSRFAAVATVDAFPFHRSIVACSVSRGCYSRHRNSHQLFHSTPQRHTDVPAVGTAISILHVARGTQYQHTGSYKTPRLTC